MASAVKLRAVKKFRTKADRTKLVCVFRLPDELGYEVRSVCKKDSVLVRVFAVPQSEIPRPIWLQTLRELATWFARFLARYAAHPSEKKERRRRLRFLKAATEKFNTHLETRTVVKRLQHGVTVPPPAEKLRMKVPYIFLYDPKGWKKATIFRVHTASCGRVDQERRRIAKRGASWIVEGDTPDHAIAVQLKEFVADDKGYDIGDFTVHLCAKVATRVTSKTVLGRISKRSRA